ncbi:hypothetical protein ACH5RR_014715 [Cinchona calisaya]|uniref:SWIB complex BAF60b domain-containing protein n=1 Tax=Cinchona calisaya TaxID=153742 RepID=A0ABD2ZR31_9GENT
MNESKSSKTPSMVSDLEIAKGVETVLRQSDPNAVTSLNGVVQQLEAKLGLDLSHKAGFIRDQISFLLQSNPQPQPQNDRFVLHNFQQFPNTHPHFIHQQQQPQFHPHFALHQQPYHQQQQPPPLSPAPPQRPRVRPPPVVKVELNSPNAGNASEPQKGSQSGTKRRGGSGGLNKVCGVSPELQAVVGEPALPRTEIVKQLWVYIRKHNLQDPGNKRRIICDDALRLVFETDCTDMFKMNKLLAKHITPLDPTKQSGEAKKLKVEAKSTTETSELNPPPLVISDALANFFGTGEKEMLQSEALRRVWEYIKVNNLEDPLNAMVILCDAKLQELLGCESISALGINEMLAHNHLFRP